MANYLYSKYKGKYRIMANLDSNTCDVPRDLDGDIAKGYDDTYIECASGDQIYHIGGSTLQAYISSVKRGNRVVQNLTEQHVQLVNIIQLDGETYFDFKAKDIEKVADEMQARTRGANTSPYSTKKLPKAKYTIPQDSVDWQEYKRIISVIPQSKLLFLSTLIQNFLNTKIQKSLGKKVKVKEDMKKKMMSTMPKEYIHSMGMWDCFLSYLKDEIANKQIEWESEINEQQGNQ